MGIRERLLTARWASLVLAAVFCVSALATAAEPRIAQSIEVAAEAVVETAPDLALLDFGVLTQADTAANASRENAKRMQAVLAAVRKAAGDDARLSTGTYSVRPVYATSREPGSPRVTGYQVSNVVHLRTTALQRVSDAIDAAIAAGANQVQRVAFGLTSDDAPRREALSKAVAAAQDKAQTIAKALGVKLGPVYSVVEQDLGRVQPLMRQMAGVAAAESAPPTPFEPGQLEVRARVVLTFEIAR
jgi:uncharacterized protein YggE